MWQRPSVPLEEAARRIGVEPARLEQKIFAGDLPALAHDGVWWLDEATVARAVEDARAERVIRELAERATTSMDRRP